jgi:hypothetical protein
LKAVNALLPKAPGAAVAPGFISNIWNPSAHGGDQQIWNQAFVKANESVKFLTGADADGVAKSEFKLQTLGDKQIAQVSIDASYLEEAANEDQYEGAPVLANRSWNYYVLTDKDGKAVDASIAPSSDEQVTYIWVPTRSGSYQSPEAAFFFDEVLQKGVPLAQVSDFEKTLDQLQKLGQPLSAAQVSSLKQRFSGIAAAYSDKELDATLKPLGLAGKDFA